MFENNKLILPEIKKAQSIEIRYLEEEQNVTDSYHTEFDSYSDIRVEKSYGPGNNQSSTRSKQEKTVLKTLWGVGLALTNAVCPEMGEILTEVSELTGVATEVVGDLTEDEEIKEMGEIISGGARIGSVINNPVNRRRGEHSCSWCDVGEDIEEITKN